MEKHALILATTRDFLWRFEQGNVKILQQMGYTVHYAANLDEPHYPTAGEPWDRAGIIPHHIPIARSPFMVHDNLRALRRLLDLTGRYAFQLIHCHTPVGGVLGRLTGRLSGRNRPVILYTAHGFHFYRGAPLLNRTAYYLVERILAHDTDILILINREDARRARHLPLRRGGRIYRIPGTGLDRERFSPPDPQRRAHLRRQMGIGADTFCLLSVGELNENKNHRLVLEALDQLRREGPDVFPIRYGICGDGFLRGWLEQRIRELNLQDIVTLYGFRSDIPVMLACADAFVFPSRREGLGMSGLEALSAGVPVIAADNRGTREYMIPGENGLIFDPDDAHQLAEHIRRIRYCTAEQHRRMARRCRESTEPFDQKYANAVMRAAYQDAQARTEGGAHGAEN